MHDKLLSLIRDKRENVSTYDPLKFGFQIKLTPFSDDRAIYKILASENVCQFVT